MHRTNIICLQIVRKSIWKWQWLVKILKMLKENWFSTKDNDDNLLFGDNPGHWDQLGEVSESLEKRFEPSCSSNCSLLDIHKYTNTQPDTLVHKGSYEQCDDKKEDIQGTKVIFPGWARYTICWKSRRPIHSDCQNPLLWYCKKMKYWYCWTRFQAFYWCFWISSFPNISLSSIIVWTTALSLEGPNAGSSPQFWQRVRQIHVHKCTNTKNTNTNTQIQVSKRRSISP